MESLTLFIDESGAKGYSDNQENESGEFGVMAGFLVPDIKLEEVISDFEIISNNILTDGKLHITDLMPSDQEQLRNDVFEYFKARKIYWLYEGIYVDGFYQNDQRIKKITTDIKSKRKSKIKISNNEKSELLHSELFLGVFGKGVALATDLIGGKFILNVITDRVDEKILDLFTKKAEKLLHVGEISEVTVTGYDPESKEIVKGTVSTRISDGHEALGDFSGVEYTLSCADNSATLAADILVNSVHHHLKEKQSINSGFPLNSIHAISGHPLDMQVYGVSTDNEIISIPDALYMHTNEYDKSK